METYANETYTDISHSTNVIDKNYTNAICGTFMAFFTFWGQIVVLVVVYNDARLRTPTNLYIISLALADLLISIISIPGWTVFTTLNYWPFSQLVCDVWNCLDHALCLISLHTIVFISIER